VCPQSALGAARAVVRNDRVLTQTAAIQGALDKVALGLLDDHAHSCVIGAEHSQHKQRTDEMMAAIGRLMRRG
jgi:DNA-binding FrmR family transcriptional regulator